MASKGAPRTAHGYGRSGWAHRFGAAAGHRDQPQPCGRKPCAREVPAAPGARRPAWASRPALARAATSRCRSAGRPGWLAGAGDEGRGRRCHLPKGPQAPGSQRAQNLEPARCPCEGRPGMQSLAPRDARLRPAPRLPRSRCALAKNRTRKSAWRDVAKVDVVTVQRALGHARATTTLDTYSHLWPSAEDRTRDAAASLMLESAGQYRATPDTASL
jgi:hypothetical protein